MREEVPAVMLSDGRALVVDSVEDPDGVRLVQLVVEFLAGHPPEGA